MSETWKGANLRFSIGWRKGTLISLLDDLGHCVKHSSCFSIGMADNEACERDLLAWPARVEQALELPEKDVYGLASRDCFQ
jgi:hypothetical protein